MSIPKAQEYNVKQHQDVTFYGNDSIGAQLLAVTPHIKKINCLSVSLHVLPALAWVSFKSCVLD